MFDYYFAGGIQSEYLIEKNCNILRSYLNDKKDINNLFEAKKNGWKGKLLIDNGAFTIHRKGGKVDIDEYINWINENHEYFDYAISLDEIPGKWGQPKTSEQIVSACKVTYDNYLYTLSKVVCPEKILPVIHMKDGVEQLKKFLELDTLEYICISGSKDMSGKQRQEWYSESFDIISHSKHPNVKVHCLGSGTIDDIIKFPFTSMDSTTSIKAASCGELCSDFGRLIIGDKLNLKRHVFNDPLKKKWVEEKCKEFGLDIDKLVSECNERIKFNINYYIQKSSETTTHYYDTMKRKEKLF